MKQLGTVFIGLAVFLGMFGWRYFFPSHLACDSDKNRESVIGLLHKGYGNFFNEMQQNGLGELFPEKLNGQMTNIQTIKKASNKTDSARCSAVFTIDNSLVLKGLNFEYTLTGDGVFSSSYRIQISNLTPVME